MKENDKFLNIGKLLLLILISIGFAVNVDASVPVTYSCCVNYPNHDGPQVDNFENIPMGGTQLEDFESIALGGIQIDSFENTSSWIGEVENPTADTINYREGQQGLKLNVTNGNKYLVDKAINLDLSTVNNFGIWLYIPDATNFSYLRLYFSSSSGFNNSYFTYSSYDGFTNGWHKLVFDKSMFTNTNNENWNNTMTIMRVIIYATLGNNTSATVDDLRYNVDNDWMVEGAGVSQQTDTVNFNEGHGGLKLGSANGNRVASDKLVNYDLSATNNLGIWLYVPDPSTFDFIRIYLSSSGSDWTSYFTASAYGGFKAGWNKLVFDKSMFVNTNNESWNNRINRIKIAIYPLPGNRTNATVDDLRYGVNNDWLPQGSGYIQNDITNVKEGLQGLKLVGINDNRYPDGGTVYIDKVIDSNFSDLNNFAVWVWVENGTNTNFVMMYLTSDSDWNKFLYSRQWSSVKRGWNKLVFSKNNFVNIGNESWNNVMSRMRIRTASITGSVGITFDDLRRDLTGDRARIMFQFDDGDLTVYTNAFPIMSRNNQTGVSFATTGFMEEPVQDPTDPFAMMIVPQLKELQSAGWDISSHTINHPDLTGVGNPAADIIPVHNESELISELNDSYNWLIANKFQKSAGYIAYPYGRFNDLVIDHVKERYVLGRSTNPQNALQYFTPEDDAVQYIQGTVNVYNDTSVQSLKDSINDSINSKLLGLVLFHVIRNGTTIDPYDYLTSDFQIISDYVKSRSADVDMITYEDLVIPKINSFTPVINKTTRIYANGSSVLITKNMYDEYMPNMTVVLSNDSIDIDITKYNETHDGSYNGSSNETINVSSVIFNESSPSYGTNSTNSGLQVSYHIGDRKPNQGYRVMINWTNDTLVQTILVLANDTGYINYDSTISGDRYQIITPINRSNYIPPTPTNITSKSESFWINTSWSPGIGNITDGYNITVNGTWANSTNNYTNSSLYPHAVQNVTVYGYNASEFGSVSLENISNNTQIPNNPVNQSPIGNKIVVLGQILEFAINSTDLDNDNITYSTNATKGSFNNSTGQFSWIPNSTDIGISTWNFSSSDEYGSNASETIMVTVVSTFNISGFKLNSSDNSGLSGWNISLLNISTGLEIANMTTDNTGSYNFTGLFNGTYNVTEEMKSGWMNVTPPSLIVTILGANEPNKNFTNALIPPPVSTFNISGFKLNSSDNSGLSGWNISLLNISTGLEIANSTTDNTGSYNFTGLFNGTYNVTEEMKPGWMNVTPPSLIVTILGANEPNTNFTNSLIPPPPTVTNPTASHEIPDDTDNDPLWGETAQLNVTVTDDSGVASVTVNLSEIGGLTAKPMTNIGGNIWSTTTNASAGTPPKIYNLTVNATDTLGNSNTSIKIPLKVMKNGDCNGNGAVNIGDATRVFMNTTYLGDPLYPLSSPYMCDVTGNGAINIGDATRIFMNTTYLGNPLYPLK